MVTRFVGHFAIRGGIHIRPADDDESVEPVQDVDVVTGIRRQDDDAGAGLLKEIDVPVGQEGGFYIPGTPPCRLEIAGEADHWSWHGDILPFATQEFGGCRPQFGADVVEPRTMSSGRKTNSSRGAGVPLTSSMSAWTAAAPIASTACRTVVSGGSVKAMSGESS